jgi:hypothetical protein
MLTAISAVLAVMIQDESTFARAEALYVESFKAGKGFTVADGIYPRSKLVQYLMEPIYKAEEPHCSELPSFGFHDDDMCDQEPEILKPGLSHQDAESLVDHLQFVELCNYKGEGEGYVLACRAKHLRVFVGKYDYFAA